MTEPFKLKTQSLVIPESYIEKQIFSYLTANGVYCWKNDSMGVFDPVRKIYRKNQNPYRIKGTSDILGCLPSGQFFAVEVKTATGKVSPEQKLFIEKVNTLGGVAFVARSVEDVRIQILKFFSEWRAHEPK